MIGDTSRYKWFILFGLVVLSLAFHTYNLDYASYDLDEAVHIWHAQKPYSEVVEQSSHDPNPPVYNLVLSTWVKLFGVSEWTTRFFSVLMGVIGVVIMFLIASRNFGLAVGVTAALLYCFSPIQFRFTHLARPYSMLMVTVLLSYGLLLECIKRPKGVKLFFYYLTTALMIYVHPTSVFNIPAQGLIIILLSFREPKKMLTLLATMVVAFFTFGIWMLAIPYFERDDPMWFGPPDWEAIYYVIKVFYGNSWLIILQLLVLVGIAIQSIRNKVMQPENKERLLTVLLWVVVPFVMSIGFSHLIKPVFQDKYILTVQPALMLLMAVTVFQLKHRILRIASVVAVFAIMFTSINTKQNPEGDWRSVVAHINEVYGENSMVFIDPWYEFRTFSYYFDRPAYEEPGRTQQILESKGVTTAWDHVYDSEKGAPKTEVVHLVRAHMGILDDEVYMNILDSSAELVEERNFIGINFRTYSFIPSLDTLHHKLLSFEETQDGDAVVSSENEFSEAIVYPLKNADSNRALRVTASVDLKSVDTMEGVAFVVSVEGDGEKHDYRSLDVTAASSSDQLIAFSEQFTLPHFESDWEIKVYVWNPGKRQFQMDNLKLIVEN